MRRRTEALAILAFFALGSCKRGDKGDGDGGAAEAGVQAAAAADEGPPARDALLAKPLEQVTQDDMAALMATLGWRVTENYAKNAGHERQYVLVGTKSGEMRSLWLSLYKMPPREVPEWKRRRAQIFAMYSEGGYVFTVDFAPRDTAEATKILAQIRGR